MKMITCKGGRESEQEYLCFVFPVLLKPLNKTLERSLFSLRWWNEPSLHLCYTSTCSPLWLLGTPMAVCLSKGFV